MKQTTALATALLWGVAVTISGCSGSSNDNAGGSGNVSFDASAVIDHTADDLIVQTYTALNNKAADLKTKIEALHAGGATEAELDAAQAAWKDTRVQWESSEGFLFGPVSDDGGLAIDPAIDSWPLDTSALTTFMAASPDVAAVDSADDGVKGFHAMEWLLFGDGITINDRTAAGLTADELNYLVSLVGSFTGQTQNLIDAWTADFNGLGAFLDTFKASNQSAAIEELVNAMGGIADEVGSGKIATPFGTDISRVDTSEVESPFSWNSLTDFHNNIQSIMNIYTGVLGSNGTSVSTSDNGVYSFVFAHDSALAQRVLNEIIDAQQKIALIKGDGDATSTVIVAGSSYPFRTQISDPSGRILVQDAIDATLELRDTLLGEVADLISKTDFAI